MQAEACAPELAVAQVVVAFAAPVVAQVAVAFAAPVVAQVVVAFAAPVVVQVAACAFVQAAVKADI